MGKRERRKKMYNISNEDRQEILKYLSTQPYANVFKLVAMIVGLKKAPEDKNSKDKKDKKESNLN
jgi:mannose/fructose/N-acetylgalactosamine-specific phosphotransferase system component IID